MSNLLQVQGGKKVTGQEKAEGLMCLFHGYGANRENLYDIAEAFSRAIPSLRIIIPNGIQKFEGYPYGDGYQWFSLKDFTQQYMQKGLEAVASKIASWIKDRLNELNLTEDKLYLSGFSQGAMLSLYLAASGLISPKKVLAYSGMFVPPSAINSKEKDTSILAIHGDSDNVVPLEMTKASYKLLSMHGLNNLKFLIENGVEHYITGSGISEGIKFFVKS
jgi:phospholipase/carboxylesterase